MLASSPSNNAISWQWIWRKKLTPPAEVTIYHTHAHTATQNISTDGNFQRSLAARFEDSRKLLCWLLNGHSRELYIWISFQKVVPIWIYLIRWPDEMVTTFVPMWDLSVISSHHFLEGIQEYVNGANMLGYDMCHRIRNWEGNILRVPPQRHADSDRPQWFQYTYMSLTFRSDFNLIFDFYLFFILSSACDWTVPCDIFVTA